MAELPEECCATSGMLVHVTSFGYKNGVPPGADLVFDVRFMENPFYIPELRERNFNIRAFGERTAANSPIQGSAADLIKIAMIRIDDTLRTKELQSKMLLQVHDELVFEVLPDEMNQVQELVKFEMEHAAELSVPLVVDLGVGENWLETKLP